MLRNGNLSAKTEIFEKNIHITTRDKEFFLANNKKKKWHKIQNTAFKKLKECN